MSTSTLTLFFALLTLAALAGAVGVAVLAVVLRGERWDGLRHDVGRVALPLAWVVATVTTLGSLYYSKVVGYPPCELCWYQRIAVYPLALVLAIALVRRDAAGVRPYAIGPCVAGILISTYHSWIQWFPPDEGTSFCTLDAPCTAKYVYELNFITLPFMAWSAFACIIALMLATRWAFPPAGADDGRGAPAGAADATASPSPQPLVPETTA